MKILAVTGIRSDYDILHPVLTELEKAGHDLFIAVSGAHLSDSHDNTWKRVESDGFQIVDKIDTLLSTDRVVQRSKGVGLLIQGLTQTTERLNPDFLLVVGDREESISAAIVGNYMNKLVIHIGGGDPVFGNADDPVRFAVSKLAHVHCCIAEDYKQNLIRLGEEEFRIFFTGNPAYANIDSVPRTTRENIYQKIGLSSEKYIVLIKHPLSSEVEASGRQIKSILEALQTFCEQHKYQVVCIPPNSDPGSYKIRQEINKYRQKDWLIVSETLERLEFINLMRNATTLIGNSSMGILEAPHYKLPVINVGNRQMGRLNAGNVEFVSYAIDDIMSSLAKACFDESYRLHIQSINNPYGDGTAAKKIRTAIESVNTSDSKWYVKQKLCLS